jgi:hypothetical protein
VGELRNDGEVLTKAQKVKLWREQNRERYNEYVRNRRRKMRDTNPEAYKLYNREKNYRAKYGITVEKFNEMLESQNNVCAICLETNEGKHLAVDHCHTTGKVRDLLCTRCNLTVEHIENARVEVGAYVAYIERHRL